MDFLQESTAANTYGDTHSGINDFMSADSVDEPREQKANARAVRWVVFAGNVLPPDFKRNVAEMRMGGENLGNSYATLTRETNGFLRRCQLAPMTLGYDFVNPYSIGKDDKAVKIFDRSKYNAITGKVDERKDYAYECLPGHELEALLSMQQGAGGQFDMGIREVEALFDETAQEPNSNEYRDAIRRGKEYQRLIFPDWSKYLNGEIPFFSRTRDLREYLTLRQNDLSSDPTAYAVIQTMLDSNEQFERYVTGQLSLMSGIIESGKVEGRIHGWRPHQNDWFDMLNLTRETFLTERMDAAPVKIVSDAPTNEEFQAQSAKIDNLSNVVEQILPAIGKLAELEIGRQPVGMPAVRAVEPEVGGDALACAGTNARGEACKGRVVKEIDGSPYCQAHGKE